MLTAVIFAEEYNVDPITNPTVLNQINLSTPKTILSLHSPDITPSKKE